jgi:limonene-1,2-epoxide hydrolase
MDRNAIGIARRELFVAGGAAALAALATSNSAGAAEPSSAEKANIALVDKFCLGWMAKDYDPDKEMPRYLADKSSVRMVEDKPPVIGPAAAAAAMKSFSVPGQVIKIEILESFAKGPVVVNSRIDTIQTPGKPDQVYKIAGVFVVKQGKIAEWTDYLVA